jgi:hypothetical protein
MRLSPFSSLDTLADKPLGLSLPARAALVLLAAWLPFLPGLGNPWLWDDALLLGQRLAPEHTAGFADIWRQPYWGQVGPPDTYRPLSLSLIYLERLAFGASVLPYHLVSLLLHGGVSLLVMALAGRFAGARVGWLCALLFAVHPIHAEAVAMVYGQLELCAALWVLATLWLYLRARQDGLRPVPFALAVLLAFAAACSKESALMLPALLLLVRAAWMSGDGNLASRARRFVRGLGWDALFLLPVLAYLLLRYDALGGLAPNPEATVTLGYSLGQRVKTVIVSVGHALRLATLPTGQTLYYGHLRDAVFGWPVDELAWIMCAVAALSWLAGRLGRWPTLFGAGWFGLALLPVANLIPTGVLVAERTLYLPSLGVCFLLAALLGPFAAARRLAPAALLLAYAAMVAGVVGHWRDAETAWRTTVAAHPRSPMGQLLLGEAMVRRWQQSGAMPGEDELNAASAAFAEAYRLNPELKQALAGQAIVRQLRQRPAAPPP